MERLSRRNGCIHPSTRSFHRGAKCLHRRWWSRSRRRPPRGPWPGQATPLAPNHRPSKTGNTGDRVSRVGLGGAQPPTRSPHAPRRRPVGCQSSRQTDRAISQQSQREKESGRGKRRILNSVRDGIIARALPQPAARDRQQQDYKPRSCRRRADATAAVAAKDSLRRTVQSMSLNGVQFRRRNERAKEGKKEGRKEEVVDLHCISRL